MLRSPYPWSPTSVFLLAATFHCGFPLATPAQIAATPASGFQGIWAEATDGAGDYPNKYGGGLATYPQQVTPMAVYAPAVNRTYFAFDYDLSPGTGLNIGHAISYFDHDTGLVARPQIWIDKQTNDAHDAPTLAIDDDGYVYMFSMTHGETRTAYISKSAQPYEIGAFTPLLSASSPSDMAVFGNPPETPGSSGAPRFSYASPWYVPNAEEDEKFVLLHTRYLSGQRDLFTTSSADGDVWRTRKALAQIESGQYQVSWIKPDGASIGSIFNVHPSGLGLDWRTDLYYVETSDQAQSWRSIDGVTLVDNSCSANNPLTLRPEGPGSGAAQVYDAAPGERVYLKDLNYDADGNPVMLFLTTSSHEPGDHGLGVPDRFVKTAHWSGSQWVVRDVTTTDHNYDHGSLYVEDDGTWRIIAPFIDGPQPWGTGGEMGMWTSGDQGQTWSLARQLTSGSYFNHTYARRPLNAQDDFYAFWADGHAWEQSPVSLLFANKNGDVYQLPTTMTGDFAAPTLWTPVEPELLISVSGDLVEASVDGRIASLTVRYGTQERTYAPSRLIPATITAFVGQAVTNPSGYIADVIMPPGTTSGPAPGLRAGLLSDGYADTGFVNMTSWAVSFSLPIVNRPGPDVVMIDWGSGDTVDIRINGVTRDDVEPTSQNVFASMANRPRFRSTQRNVTSLSALESAQLTLGPLTTGSSTAYAIDLSDFGFLPGDVLDGGELIEFLDGQGIDPLEIFGLPTPGDFVLNGSVDGQDLLAWQRGLFAEYDQEDLTDWKAYFGVGAGATASSRPVCEPKCGLLAAVALLSQASTSARRNGGGIGQVQNRGVDRRATSRT